VEVERNTSIVMGFQTTNWNKIYFTLWGLVFFLGLSQKSTAQKIDSTLNFSGIIIDQDPKIPLILERRLEINRRYYNAGFGYRILLYSGNKRQEAYNYQSNFKMLFPNLETYLSFNFPNFKLLGGDFRNRDDAQKIANQVKKLMPLSPVCMPGKIDPNKAYPSY